jgi:NADH pyrophosphatase NudC (nudix superfamily)
MTKTSDHAQLFGSFRFCPGCGSAGIGSKTDRSIECGSCGFHFFFNAAAAVAGLIEDDQGRLLLAIRAHDPKKGTLHLPGGFVDFNESAEDALMREIREELGLNVIRCSYFGSLPNTYTYDNITYHTLDLAYVCVVESFESLSLSDEIAGIQFLSPGEIKLDLIGFDSIRSILSRYIQTKVSGIRRKEPVQ